MPREGLVECSASIPDPDLLVGRDRLNVELDVVLGEPRAQRVEIVVKSCRTRRFEPSAYTATRVFGASARNTASPAPSPRLILWHRIEGIETIAVTLRAGPGEYSTRLVKIPGAIDSRWGSTASGANADPSNLKKRRAAAYRFARSPRRSA